MFHITARGGKRNGGRPRLLALATSTLLTLAVLVVGASPAYAVTRTLGQNRENYYCSAGYEWIQTAASSAIYAAPSKGKLTKWMIYGGADGGSMQFEVWRPVGGTSYKLLYISPTTTLTPGVLSQVTLSPKVRVKKGDVIGLRSVTQIDCAFETGSPADTYVYNLTGSVPTVGSTVAFTGDVSGFQFNIAALFK